MSKISSQASKNFKDSRTEERREQSTLVKKERDKLNEEAFEALLDAMTVYSDKIPVLPLATLKRDEIYRDHN